MRLQLLACGLVVALAFAVLTLGAGAPPAPPAATPRAVPKEPGAAVPEPPPPPARDVFRYAEAVTPGAHARPAVARAVRPAPEPLTPQPVPLPLRLVGLVRGARGLRAAVATSGDVVVVGPGDVVEGYAVVGVDEDRGLRLRAPDGREIALLLEP